MKRLFTDTLILTIPSIILCFIVFEIFFRSVIPATNFPYSYFDPVDQILRFDTTEDRDGVYTIGKFAHQRGRWHINNYGWNSLVDYHTRNKVPLIAIIGDSYIEGFQVNVEENMASRLRILLEGKYQVYSFGISGAPLSQYLQMSRYAVKHLHPDILVINVVHNDFDESLVSVRQNIGMLAFDVKNDEIVETAIVPYKPSYMRRSMRYSSIVRYLQGNLGLENMLMTLFKKDNNQAFNANIDVKQVKKMEHEIELAVDYAIRKLKEENGQRKVMVMVDALRQDIYNGTLQTSNIAWMNRLLKRKCEKYGIYFLDLTDDFNNLYKKYHIKFESDYDGHWNNYGHESAAKSLLKYLLKNNIM